MDDPIAQNIQGVQQLVGSKLNKTVQGVDGGEGLVGEAEDSFTLKLSDEKLLKLAYRWTTKYLPYEGKIRPRQNAALMYYLGKQKEGSSIATDGQPISTNILFEAVETFLPAALAKNPEPVVYADSSEKGTAIANAVKTMLQKHADILVLRAKLAQMVRNWTVDFLGVIKFGWNDVIGDITIEVRDAKNFIFDPEGYIDSYGDYVGYLGERITKPAEDVIALFPKHSAYITVKALGKLGSDITYTEWWNDDYCFYTLGDVVLDKHKNPNFNYEKKVPAIGLDGGPELDETGVPVEIEQKGRNHFAIPKKPYVFLSVFSFGTQPHDVTGLIEQNIPNQRRISRRTEQIDYNLSRANNSDVFSEDNFTQETAKQAASALAKGHPVIVPPGQPLDRAIMRLKGNDVGSSFFNELEISKSDLRSIFGVQGITAQQQDEDQTARGMILNNQYDSSRIGGGIGDKIEQVAKNIFNYMTQMYYVFYDTEHFASMMGQMKAVEYVELSSQMLPEHLVVSVSPDSMKPKDEVTEMNEVLALWEAGLLDPKTVLTMRNFPDPQKTAAQAVLWKVNPQAYLQLNFPDIAQLVAPPQLPGAPGAEGSPNPETVTEPPGPLSAPPGNASLSQVPLPQ